MYIPKEQPSLSLPIPGLEEAIQRTQAEREANNPSSPTGTPKVRPSAVPWIVGAMVGAVAGLEVCATSIPSPTGQLACRIGAVVLAGVLGVVSPGWRSAPK